MTRKLTPAQLDEIEAAAKKAGDEVSWAVETRGIEVRIPEVVSHQGLLDPDDAAHIAMMDPATTLALVAEVRELRAKVERVREVHRRIPVYETCDEGGCENAHCFETAVGDYAHDDDLVGHVCYGCSELSDEEPIYWTCDTIKALGEEA